MTSWFANLSPLDHRYHASAPELWEELSGILSEEAYIRYQMQVEWALVEALERRGLCPKGSGDQVRAACERVSPEDVRREEERTRHNIRALVNCLQGEVGEKVRPFIHLTATSADVMDTARALQLRDVTNLSIVPRLKEFLTILITLAEKTANIPTVGRTHGQHGVPITFGFAIAEYISRLGSRLVAITNAKNNLRGKMAGAVGAYNASSLLCADPMEFEKEVLGLLGLTPGGHSTQIVEPEYTLDLGHTLVSTFGVLANFADDMRHLQRTEISEVGEAFAEGQVGSSTMPHKRNPWNFEHVKSLWKAFMPRMVTLYMDQISEHQRDLTNSASGRFVVEIAAALAMALERLIKVTKKLSVDEGQMLANLKSRAHLIVAEPLYILLASYGHPDAHEAVRKLTLEAEKTGQSLADLAQASSELASYTERFTPEQRKVISDPLTYTGQAATKCVEICTIWSQKITQI
ncbi:MAG TPA: adenylosuccinate lyase [Firmicutes bacterium]|jgi:adenylosuccinate lyase|nr:adenylosuccinate lyase [Bacillota bacterium]